MARRLGPPDYGPGGLLTAVVTDPFASETTDGHGDLTMPNLNDINRKSSTPRPVLFILAIYAAQWTFHAAVYVGLSQVYSV